MSTLLDQAIYRRECGQWMEKTVQDEAQRRKWAYEFVRPQEVDYSPAQYENARVIQSDCSDGCRIVTHLAGVPEDPAGMNYEQWGNSTSIFFHLDHIALKDVSMADILTFGFFHGEKHAAMVYKYDPDPAKFILWNDGTQGQPVFSTLQAEVFNHRGMAVTACQLHLPPNPPLTHDAILRAKTGYYSWMAWKLGEGVKLWKPYGAANPNVRPNVPKVIPLAWWKARVLYLANRDKGNKPTAKK